MEEEYLDIHADNKGGIGDRAFTDLTDRENDEFIYVYQRTGEIPIAKSSCIPSLPTFSTTQSSIRFAPKLS